jgi:hypothetical protein
VAERLRSLDAYVVMPDHAHVLWTPHIQLSHRCSGPRDRPPVGRKNCWDASASHSGRRSTLTGWCAARLSSSKFGATLN